MKILSVTTSSPICGVAILEDCSPIKEFSLNNGLTHSETLLPLIKQILEETNLKLSDIDLLACDVGPGSFTGIRIGIATIKGFSDSLNITSCGINALEALCYNVKSPSIICSLIDAKKDNVFCQIFEPSNEFYIKKQNASFENIDNFILNLQHKNFSYPLVFVGNGSLYHKEKILKYLPNSQFAYFHELSAINVGICGIFHYKNNISSNLEPLYLRKSEAEQKLEDKQNGFK